jgi:hypothetical protein
VTPGSVTQLAILVVFVLPGVVYQVVRARLAGPSPENQDTTNKVLRALAASVVLVSLYMIVLGPTMVRVFTRTGADHGWWVVQHPRQTGVLVGVFLMLVPALAALLVVARWSLAARVAGHRSRFPLSLIGGSLERLEVRAQGRAGIRYDPTPTAWDWAVDHAATFTGFVRVRTSDGQWRGGVFGAGSYFSTYPEPPAIFVEQAWQLDESGAFVAEQDLSRGAWLPCVDATTVEFTGVQVETESVTP